MVSVPRTPHLTQFTFFSKVGEPLKSGTSTPKALAFGVILFIGRLSHHFEDIDLSSGEVTALVVDDDRIDQH